MKKIILTSCSVFLVAILAIAGYSLYKMPVDYISLDINPSIELGINAFNKVISVNAVNQDGEILLEETDVINQKVPDAISKLLVTAAEKDYISDDGSTVVAITAESKSQKKAERLQNLGSKAVENAARGINVIVAVYKDASDLSLRNEAKSLGISPGKLKLIKTLQVLDPTITIDQYKDAKVSEIMSDVKVLIEENKDTDVPARTKAIIDRLKETSIDSDLNVKRSEIKDMKEKAKSEFFEIKKQAEEIKSEAHKKAEELRNQAKELIANINEMSEEEKAEALQQAEELKKQAELIINEAETYAEELKDLAEANKDEVEKQADEIERQIEEQKKERLDEINKRKEELADRVEDKLEEAKKRKEEAAKRVEEQLEEAKKRKEETAERIEEKLEEAKKRKEEAAKRIEEKLEEVKNRKEGNGKGN